MPPASQSSSSSSSGSDSRSGSGSSSSNSSRSSASSERSALPASKVKGDAPKAEPVALPPPPKREAAQKDVVMKDAPDLPAKPTDQEKPPQRSSKENGRAPSPELRHRTKLHVGHLTRNVQEGHVKEIFSNFGDLKSVELAMDRFLGLPRGFAYVEYNIHEDAVKAQKHMNGGQLDGNILTVEFPPLPSKHGPPPSTRPARPVSPARRHRDDRLARDRSRRDRVPPPRRHDSPGRAGYGRRPVTPPRRRPLSPPRRSRRESPRRRSSPSRRRLPSPPRERRRRSPSPRRRRNTPTRRRSRSPIKKEAERKPAAKRRSETPSSSGGSSSASQSSSGSGSSSSSG